jgi:hypothetical protein
MTVRTGLSVMLDLVQHTHAVGTVASTTRTSLSLTMIEELPRPYAPVLTTW